MNHPPDHYKMLGIARDAPPEAVRAAYRRRAQKYHPDRYKGGGDADATMARINRAYEVLSDPEHRARYDASFAAAAPAAPGEVVMGSAEKRSWLLLWAVISFTVVTLGWVALRTLVPTPAHMPAPALVRQAPIEDAPLAPAPPIEPWKPAAPTARVRLPSTEPVERLMREGTLSNSPSRRKEGASAR